MMHPELESTPEIEDSKPVRTSQELKIIEEQVHAPAAKVKYWTLFRYATKWDILCLFVGSICSIVGGSALPFMALFIGRLAGSFSDQYTGVISFVQADHNVSSNSLFITYLGIGEFLTLAIAMTTFSVVGEHITLRIREEYVKATLRQNIAYFDKLGAGEAASRASTEINLIREGISEKVVFVLGGLSCFVSALVVSFIESWKLALIVMTSIVALILVMGSVAKLAIKFKSKSLEYQSAADNVIEEAISSIRTVTAFDAQEKLVRRYDVYLRQAEYWTLLNRTTTGCMIGLSLCIIYAEHALSFWQGSRFLVKGEISLIAIITIQIAIMMGGAYFSQALPHLHSFTSAVAAANKVFSVIDRISPLDPQSEEGLTIDNIKGDVEFKDLSFAYPSRPNVTIFNDFNLTIRAGETTAIAGPSGCGKSTLIALMERFYKPLAGTILVDGHDIAELNLQWWRQQIALVNQEPILFSGSIFENIEFGLIGSEYEKKSKEDKFVLVMQAAKIANAHDFIIALPSGYDTQVGDGGRLLSGGQRQRVTIARAVVSDPKILLLDEATSNLDATAEAAVQAAIEQAAQGRTTIIIAHKLSMIKRAVKIVIISDGHIVEEGAHCELAAQDGAYTELLRAQDLGGNATHMEERSATVQEHTLEEQMNISHSRTKSVGKDESEKAIELFGEKEVHDTQRTSQPKPKSPSILELAGFMWSLNKYEAWSIFMGSCFSILSGSNQPVRGIFFAHSILALSYPGNIRQQSNFWAGMFLMLGVIQLVACSFQGLAFARSSARLIHRVQTLASRSILNQGIPFFDKLENSAGSLTSLLSSEASQLAGLSGATIGAILVFVTTVLGSIGIALGFGWKLSLVGMSVMAPLILCGFFRFWLLANLEKRRKQTTRAGTFVSQAITSIRTVASLTMETEILLKYRQMIISEALSRTWFIIKSSTLYALSQSFMFLAAALGFWYGGKLVAHGEYDILQFFICFSETLFGAQAAGAILSFAPEVGTGRSAAESFKRLIELKGVDFGSGEKSNAVKGTLEFRDVYFHYPERQTTILQGLSFKAKVGQFTAIVGASGSGKSTALALIERFYEPTSGSILLDDEDISRLSLQHYRKHLALVNQETTLYDGTIRENIIFDRDVAEENLLVEACKAANIYEFIVSLPDGFNTRIGPKGSSLSGGQRQRLAIARALLREPKILLLDEATSALDSASEEIVEKALRTASKGRTTIAIAHRLSSIYHADLIYVLDAGRVVESGAHAELMAAKGTYWTMVGLQSLEIKT